MKKRKIYGDEMKFVLQYALVKKLQVLYGNCLFKYPKTKEKALLIKLCIKEKNKQCKQGNSDRA